MEAAEEEGVFVLGANVQPGGGGGPEAYNRAARKNAQKVYSDFIMAGSALAVTLARMVSTIWRTRCI
jgi:prolyl oligopeptidase PreP (S9A serine peptidase family)